MTQTQTHKREKKQSWKNDRQRENGIWTAGGIGLAFLFFLQAALAIPQLSATTDEPVHISAGYSYWQTRDFRMNPEHPPLAKLLAALPLFALNPKLDTSNKDWSTASEYPFGFAFLYGNDADRLLFWGRMPMIALAALGCLITFLFARDLFGPQAGTFAAGMYCFCPNLLAHGMLITTDVPLSTFALLTLYLFWRQPSRPGWHSSVLVGLALGAAMTCKFSGALLPILIMGLVAVRTIHQKSLRNAGSIARSFDRKQAIISEVQNLATMASASLLVITAAYLFSVSPIQYFKNMTLVNANHETGYQSYMLGQLSETGWWYYFLVAFIVKATVPTLIIISIAATKMFSGFIDSWGEIILLSAIAMYFVAVSAAADDLGVRYLLPIFPLIYVWGSRIVPSLWNKRFGRSAVCLLLVWQIWAAISSFPNYVPYFNELAGGAKKGPDILDDSNVDWGQSLKQVADYVQTKRITNFVLCPFSGFDNPAYYGLNSVVQAPKQLVSSPPGPGTYIISGHNVAWMKAVSSAWRTYQPVDQVGGMWVYRF